MMHRILFLLALSLPALLLAEAHDKSDVDRAVEISRLEVSSEEVMRKLTVFFNEVARGNRLTPEYIQNLVPAPGERLWAARALRGVEGAGDIVAAVLVKKIRVNMTPC